MPIPFSTSLRALEAEQRDGLGSAAGLALALLVAWGAWLTRAELALVEVSARASVESAAAAVPVTTLTAGRVATAHLGLGRRVAAGEVLVTLDDGRLRLERAALAAELAGLRAQLAAGEGEAAAITAAIEAHERGGRARASEAQASAREAEVEALLAARTAARTAALARQGIEADEADERSQAALWGRQAGATARRRQVARTAAEVRERVALLGVELARLRREEAELRGAIARGEAALAAFDRRLAEHRITAPSAGVLGHAPPLQPGAALAEHATVAHVVPDGELRIVAAFPPAAIGRLAPGQPARLRLHGFPWTEFGSLRGAIVQVASEAVDGAVRVECSLDPTSAPAIPLGHGLVGALEVEVERVTPATLLLRGVGRALERPASP